MKSFVIYNIFFSFSFVVKELYVFLLVVGFRDFLFCKMVNRKSILCFEIIF